MSDPVRGDRRDGQPRIRVLVVDDSAVIRRLVTDVLAEDPQIEVVGIAENGKVAVERIDQLRPDAVTMDIEMPVMNGIEAVRALRRTQPRLPVVMFSTLTERGAAATLDALAAGASDYVTKPSNVGSLGESRQNIKDQLIPKLKALAGARRLIAGLTAAPPGQRAPAPAPPGQRAPGAAPAGQRVPAAAPPGQRTAPGSPPAGAAPSAPRPRSPRTSGFAALLVGCSTGGPDALAHLLPALPRDLPVPVLVVQHMPPVFTRLLSERLGAASALKVKEAAEGDAVVPGQVLVAPGGFHLEARRAGAGVVAHLTEAPPENYCRPAVDVLFRTAAAVWAERVLAVVLTGMGRDGEKGAKAVRDAGGAVYAQDELTSVVWGMPGAVVGAGLAEQILPLEGIAAAVVAALGRAGSRAPQPLGGTR